MRIFAVPAALLLACCVYLPLPRARDGLDAALRRLYSLFARAFTRKNGQTDEDPRLTHPMRPKRTPKHSPGLA